MRAMEARYHEGKASLSGIGAEFALAAHGVCLPAPRHHLKSRRGWDQNGGLDAVSALDRPRSRSQ